MRAGGETLLVVGTISLFATQVRTRALLCGMWVVSVIDHDGSGQTQEHVPAARLWLNFLQLDSVCRDTRGRCRPMVVYSVLVYALLPSTLSPRTRFTDPGDTIATLTGDEDGVIEKALYYGRRVEAYLVDEERRMEVTSRMNDQFNDSWSTGHIPVSAEAAVRLATRYVFPFISRRDVRRVPREDHHAQRSDLANKNLGGGAGKSHVFSLFCCSPLYLGERTGASCQLLHFFPPGVVKKYYGVRMTSEDTSFSRSNGPAFSLYMTS